MFLLINKKIGRSLERNNGNDIMNKKKILIIGNGCNNNYIKKILESNYDIIIRDKNDYSNLKGYEFDFVFIDEHFKIDEKLTKQNERILEDIRMNYVCK